MGQSQQILNSIVFFYPAQSSRTSDTFAQVDVFRWKSEKVINWLDLNALLFLSLYWAEEEEGGGNIAPYKAAIDETLFPCPLLSLIVPGSNFQPYRCWTIEWLLGLGRRRLSTVSYTGYPQPLSYTIWSLRNKEEGGEIQFPQSSFNVTQERWLWGFWGRGDKTLASTTRTLARHEKTWCRNTSFKSKTIFLTYKKVQWPAASEI